MIYVPITSLINVHCCDHFDLGVDHLASPDEISEMSDPWTSAIPPQQGSAESAPMQVPPGELGVWARELDLPGTGG